MASIDVELSLSAIWILPLPIVPFVSCAKVELEYEPSMVGVLPLLASLFLNGLFISELMPIDTSLEFFVSFKSVTTSFPVVRFKLLLSFPVSSFAASRPPLIVVVSPTFTLSVPPSAVTLVWLFTIFEFDEPLLTPIFAF